MAAGYWLSNYWLGSASVGSGSFTVPTPPAASTGSDLVLSPNFAAGPTGLCPYRPVISAVIENRFIFMNGWGQPQWWDGASNLYNLGSTVPTSFSPTADTSGSVFAANSVQTYRCVFRNSTTGKETAPQLVTITDASTFEVDFTWSDPGGEWTHASIYRQLADTGFFVLTADTTIATEAYTDNEADATIRLRRAYVRRYRETLPPVFVAGITYKNRLICWTGNDSNLHVGQTSRPDGESVVGDFPSGGISSNGGILQVDPNDNDLVTAGIVKGRFAYIFKRRAAYVLDGENALNYAIAKMFSGRGCLGPRCVTEADGWTYILDERGLLFTDLTGEPFIAGAPTGTTDSPMQPVWDRMNLDALKLFSLYFSEAEGLIYVIGCLDHDVEPVPIAVYDSRNHRFVSQDSGVPAFAMGRLEDGAGIQYDMRVDELGNVWQQDIGNSDGVYAGSTTGSVTSVGSDQTLTDTATSLSTVALDNALGAPLDRYDLGGDVVQESRVAGVTATTLRALHFDPTTPLTTDQWAVGVKPWIVQTIKSAFKVPGNKKVRRVDFETDVTSGTLRVDMAFDENSFTNEREMDLSQNEGKTIVKAASKAGRRFHMRLTMRYSGMSAAIHAWTIRVRQRMSGRP